MGHTHEGLPATVVSNTLKGPLDCLNATVVRGDAVDVGAVLRRVYATLAQSGRLVFSVEHPIITSSDQAWQGHEPRQAWLVDDYFVTGRRETEWITSCGRASGTRSYSWRLSACRSPGWSPA